MPERDGGQHHLWVKSAEPNEGFETRYEEYRFKSK